MGVQIGILEYRRAPTEIRHDPKVEILINRAFEDGADTPHEKSIGTYVVLIIGEEASIRLKVATYSQLEVSVCRFEEEPILPRCENRGLLGLCCCGFLLHLPTPFQKPHFLIKSLHTFLSRFGGRGLLGLCRGAFLLLLQALFQNLDFAGESIHAFQQLLC